MRAKMRAKLARHCGFNLKGLQSSPGEVQSLVFVICPPTLRLRPISEQGVENGKAPINLSQNRTVVTAVLYPM